MSEGWKRYIHNLRRREIEALSGVLDGKHYGNILEMGGGDGYQSKILSKYSDNVYCVDLNINRFDKRNDSINYVVCDAEQIDRQFPEGFFDLIFSSNVLEHLEFPRRALCGVHHILKGSGLSVHIIPNSFSAVIRIILWYPGILFRVLRKVLRDVQAGSEGMAQANRDRDDNRGNNLKTESMYKSNLHRILLPRPHGVSKTVFKEFQAWKKTKWCLEFEKSGFRIISVLKGPVSSGYGFKMEWVRNALERLGLSSEYIYVCEKRPD